MSRRHFIKTAVSAQELEAVKRQADLEGITLPAYFRAALARDLERQSFDVAVAALRADLAKPAGGGGGEDILAVVEPVLVELLQQVRLLGGSLNPQTAARATQHVNSLYPNRRIK